MKFQILLKKLFDFKLRLHQFININQQQTF